MPRLRTVPTSSARVLIVFAKELLILELLVRNTGTV
jgi:hypothetical protein